MLAITEAYRSGLLKLKNWYPNIIAGLIVGVVALPLAMAFAIASGVKPEQGLYTAIIAGLFVSLFGGSQVQIAGPTGAFIVILASITAKYGVAGLQIATLMAGIILVLMGIIKLGNIIKFIPDPVIVGFTAGIGFIIFVGEWKDFFGLTIHVPIDAYFLKKLYELIKALPHLHWATTALATLSLLLVIFTPKIIKHVPGPLAAMLVATVIQAIFHFPGVATLGSAFGGIPQHLPHFQVPEITLSHSLALIGPAFTIALLGAIESLLSAAAADGLAGTRHDSNQELIGQGLANLAAPLFGGFAATGAIARTATNIRSGGNSPLAGIVHAIFLLLIIILLAPSAAYIPLCSLAAILFVIAFNMSDIPHFIYMMKRAPHYDILVLLTTFLLTIFVDLVVAVNVGVILAILFFLRRMSQSVTIEEQQHETLSSEITEVKIPKDLIVYTIHGPFFFGVAEKIERTLAATNSDPKKIIFRLKEVPFMDITGLQTFYELINEYNKRGVKIYLCEASGNVDQKLKNFGILNHVENHKIYKSVTEALKSII